MKQFAPIGLLLLLLYNTFGLSVAVVLFQNDYQSASAIRADDDWLVIKTYFPTLPYSENISVSGQMEGLFRQGDQFYNPTDVSHEHDTLYVTLKSNQAARDRFVELANSMETLVNPESSLPETARGKVLKILSGLLKHYIPASSYSFPASTFLASEKLVKYSSFSVSHYPGREHQLTSPPPEHV